jgi:hypothetical protein
MKPVGTIICRRPVFASCRYCSRQSTKLCDFPVVRDGKPGTCDTRLCDRCAMPAGKSIDYCKPHSAVMMRKDQEGQ